MTGPRRNPWLAEFQPLIWLAVLFGFLYLASHLHGDPRRPAATPRATLGRLWRPLVAWLPTGGVQRPIALGLVTVALVGLLALLWHLTRPNLAGRKVLGFTGGHYIRQHGPLTFRKRTIRIRKRTFTIPGRTFDWARTNQHRIGGRLVTLGVKASNTHIWALGPINSGKTTVLCNLILGEIRAGRSVVALDPNGAMTLRILPLLSPAERERVLVVNPVGDDAPPINVLAAADPSDAAEFITDLFRSIAGGGSMGSRQEAVLRRAILALAKRPGATLVDLPRYLRTEASDEDAKFAPGIIDRLEPFMAGPIRRIIGRTEDEDIFSAIDRGRTVLIRVPDKPYGRLLAAVALARLWDRIQRRIPDAPVHHLTIVLDELGALVKEAPTLVRMLDQVRSRNVCLVLAHQRLSQLGGGMVDALEGSALTRIVFRLADASEARIMAGHLAKPSAVAQWADKLMELRDHHAAIRLVAKGRPHVTRLFNVPHPYPWSLPVRGRIRVRRAAPETPHAPHAEDPRAPRRVVAIRVTDASTPTAAPQIARIERGRGPETGPKDPPDLRSSTDQEIPTINQTPSSAPPYPLPSLPGLRLTPRDLDILALVAEHGLATSEQLARAYWSGGPAKRLATADTGPARKRLAALARAGALRTAGSNGGAQQQYVVTPLGARLIGREGCQPPKLADPALPHRLAVVDFGTALIAATRAAGGTLTWDGEGTLCRDETLPGRPDGRIALTMPAGSLSAWVEVDRGTEGWGWLGPKLERLAAHGGADAILVAFTSPGRAQGAATRLPVADGIVVAGALLSAHVADPLGTIWTPAGATSPVSLLELAGKVTTAK